ncbi:MAG TPA: hypothetical protein DEP72_02895 [Clostridiales bacterium]|nr:MAG: hypothetical protein A2Y18_07825 [Clostridiales bacterium GWD2_32_19]HCC07102.1 hypothetical protein [Clostridiales bacterium]
MPRICNIENNIIFEINLLKNDYLDVDLSRDDFENWVPFQLLLKVEKEEYSYKKESGATFSLYELKKLIKNIQELVVNKKSGCEVDRFEFSSAEAYFDIIFIDSKEEDSIILEVWINVGSLTNGELYGYDKGFRFVVYIKDLEKFTTGIHEQLKGLNIFP